MDLLAYMLGKKAGGGGDAPSGTIDIATNGSHNVKAYAMADVNVPNTYAAGDEGKVVSNGTLKAQTSVTKTENGTYDTTENNQVVVNIPSPTGNINITDMQSTNVSAYATAQVIDSDLVAGNIKKDVNILGVVGTFEGSGGAKKLLDYNDLNGADFTYSGSNFKGCPAPINARVQNDTVTYENSNGARALFVTANYPKNIMFLTPIPADAKKLYIWMAASASGGYPYLYLYFARTPVLTGTGPGNFNGGEVKSYVLTSDLWTAEGIEAQSGLTIHVTSNLAFPFQCVEIDISSITEQFYLNVYACTSPIRIYDIQIDGTPTQPTYVAPA